MQTFSLFFLLNNVCVCVCVCPAISPTAKKLLYCFPYDLSGFLGHSLTVCIKLHSACVGSTSERTYVHVHWKHCQNHTQSSIRTKASQDGVHNSTEMSTTKHSLYTKSCNIVQLLSCSIKFYSVLCVLLGDLDIFREMLMIPLTAVTFPKLKASLF